ncbi:propionyl-CoA carboxylase [Macrolepiota fuliginosa MF-IS2]|uniref:Propionyl-CoA carboxylase n=1 Tax=Macrolepiota fuliginosa MF-IS2 TaxID=1400762 RepID=A0A9P6BZM9_9AGAR|nr:propionyl-CoA carboxylase [Macrolepiota fuliginosa MF-IS2]
MSPKDDVSKAEPQKSQEQVLDDELSWEYPVARLRALQKQIRTPNPKNPGYIRQIANNKLWVHKRIATLLDEGSFEEIGLISGKPSENGSPDGFTPANCVMGWGKIRDRKVFVTADDFSVRGGHADGGIQGKAAYGETLARRGRVPLIRLLDGSSGGGSVATYLSIGATYIPGLAGLGQCMDAMAVVPVASALVGPVVGLAAAKAAISHFTVMVKGLSQLFAAGPPVVRQATFEDLSKEALGGWEIHATNGTVDNVATSEVEAYDQIRTFLSYLPSSIFSLPPVLSSVAAHDTRERREEELIRIIPRRRARPYDVRKLIQLIVDRDDGSESSFFEIGMTWGKNIVTGFARLDGRPVGVLSSDCTANGGAIDALGSQKTTRFVNLCDHFGLPILNLVDQPGFAIGTIAEKMATIRHGAGALAALYHASVPIFTVILRRAFGVAGGAFADPDDGFGKRVAWPSGDWGSLPLEGGIEAAYKRQLDVCKTEEEREQLMTDLLAQFEDVRSPLKTAHKFGIEEIIDPRDTRPMACDWIAHVYEHVLPQVVTLRQARFGWDAKPSSGKGYKL